MKQLFYSFMTMIITLVGVMIPNVAGAQIEYSDSGTKVTGISEIGQRTDITIPERGEGYNMPVSSISIPSMPTMLRTMTIDANATIGEFDAGNLQYIEVKYLNTYLALKDKLKNSNVVVNLLTTDWNYEIALYEPNKYACVSYGNANYIPLNADASNAYDRIHFLYTDNGVKYINFYVSSGVDVTFDINTFDALANLEAVFFRFDEDATLSESIESLCKKKDRKFDIILNKDIKEDYFNVYGIVNEAYTPEGSDLTYSISYDMEMSSFYASVVKIKEGLTELTIPESIKYHGMDARVSDISSVGDNNNVSSVETLTIEAYFGYEFEYVFSDFTGLKNLILKNLATEGSDWIWKIDLPNLTNLEYIVVNGDMYDNVSSVVNNAVQNAKDNEQEYKAPKVVFSLPTKWSAGVVELSAADLMDFNNNVDPNVTNYTFKLTEDIHLIPSNDKGIQPEWPGYIINWTEDNPITLHSGWTFDGQGHVITFEEDNYYGLPTLPLFTEVKEGATVKNLFIKGIGDVQDTKDVLSPFILTNNGMVTRCAVASMSYIIENLQTTSTQSLSVGLLVGVNNGTVKECGVYNSSISYENESPHNAVFNIGGLIGDSSNGSVIDCLAYSPDGSLLEDVAFIGNTSFSKNFGFVAGRLSTTDATQSKNVFYSDQGEYQDGEIKPSKLSPNTNETYLQDSYVLNRSSESDYSFFDKVDNPVAWTYLSSTYLEEKNMYDLCIDGIIPSTPMMQDMDIAYDKTKKQFTFIVEDVSEWKSVTDMIYDNYDLYKTATVKLANDIIFDSKEIKTFVSGENVISVNNYYDGWPLLGYSYQPFLGTLDGQGHSIVNAIVFDSEADGVFGYLGDGAEVKNLNIVNSALIMANPYYDDLSGLSKSDDGKKVYLGILAQENKGTISNCSFSGNLFIDLSFAKSCAMQGFDIEWTPVADAMPATASISNSLFYIANLENLEATVTDGSNKRNIVIMQNLGVGRNAGQTQKVCNNRKNKKSLSAAVGSDVNNDYREYTDEEMASGEPAYWLNFEGKGYTGTYSRKWSKGKMYPIMATSLSAPAVKIVYDIDGVSESEAGLISPTFFANEDDEVEINVTMAPDKVWVGNSTPQLNSATRITRKLVSSACKNGVVTVHLKYGTTAISNTNSSAEAAITAKGQSVVISAAEGLNYSIVDLKGQSVASGTVASAIKTVILPSAGIYVVKVGDMVRKIVVR